jgi:hypothetical protein
MDSLWDEDVTFSAGAEWSKISTEFTNVHYWKFRHIVSFIGFLF